MRVPGRFPRPGDGLETEVVETGEDWKRLVLATGRYLLVLKPVASSNLDRFLTAFAEFDWGVNIYSSNLT